MEFVAVSNVIFGRKFIGFEVIVIMFFRNVEVIVIITRILVII